MPTPPVPFLDLAGPLYQARSFEDPPPQVAAGAPPEAWACYEPEAAAADGTGAAAVQKTGFRAFMATAKFQEVKRQIIDRIGDCQSFAAQHLPPADAKAAQDGFATFLSHLGGASGLAFFDDSQLELLYGLGKRCLDDFCLLLRHPGIELHQRKQAVRELAQQVTACRGTGPAFIEALQAIQRPEGSLHGTYWKTLKEMFEQVILQEVRATQAHEDAPDNWLQSMEVHIVNRYKLDLGLPGADPHDRFSRGTLVKPESVAACAQRLLDHCRPADAALALAAQYRERLIEAAAAELEGSAVSGERPRVDPSEPEHLDALLRAHQRLSSTFTGVSLNSLLREDVDTGTFHWREDDALVARELLLQLHRQGFIQEPLQRTVAKGEHEGRAWQLKRLDRGLFYVEERDAGDITGLPELSTMRLPHLQALIGKAGGVGPQHAGALVTVLAAEPAEALMDFPAAWLQDAGTVDRLLLRLGPERSAAWAKVQRPQDRALTLVLQGATRLGHGELVWRLLAGLQDQPPSATLRRGGFGVFFEAARSGCMDTVRAWRLELMRDTSALSEDDVKMAISGEDRQFIVPWLMAHGSAELLKTVLQLLFDLSDLYGGQQPLATLQIVQGVGEGLAAGRLDHLDLLAKYQLDALKKGWLRLGAWPCYLDGSLTERTGCRHAVLNDQPEAVRWFNDRIISLAESGHLAHRYVRQLLTGGGPMSVVHTAIELGRHECLAQHLQGLLKATSRRMIPASELTDILKLTAPEGMPPMHLLMLESSGRSAALWTDAIVTAHRDGVLSGDQVMQILTAPAAPNGLRLPAAEGAALLPFFSRVSIAKRSDLLPNGRRFEHWGAAVARFHREKVLTHEQVLTLLAGVHRGDPALLVAMQQANSVRNLQSLYLKVHAEGLVNDDELVDLLAGRSRNAGGGSAFSQATATMAQSAMRLLAGHVQTGALPRAVYDRVATAAAEARTEHPDEQVRLATAYRNLAPDGEPAATAATAAMPQP